MPIIKMSNIEHNFNNWKKNLNELVFSKIQRNLDDLPDQTYRIWHESKLFNIEQLSIIIIGDYYKVLFDELKFILD
tara:strand:+ start:485 stop:712 length:228 start_codon:yes stop_codon:yes gene_type:complete